MRVSIAVELAPQLATRTSTAVLAFVALAFFLARGTRTAPTWLSASTTDSTAPLPVERKCKILGHKKKVSDSEDNFLLYSKV